MKKSILFLTCLCMLLMLCACGKTDEGESEVANMVNPMTEVTAEEAFQALGVSPTLEDSVTIGDVFHYAVEPELWEFEITVDGQSWEMRMAHSEEEADISGVYLADEVEATIYDSDGSVPSVTVASDSEYTVAYCLWQGYAFSISGDCAQKDAGYDTCVLLALAVIGG